MFSMMFNMMFNQNMSLLEVSRRGWACGIDARA
jgi:hypothetical protein